MKVNSTPKLSSRDILANYLPDRSLDLVLNLFATYKVKFRIVKPRKSKLGDFRVDSRKSTPEITVNGNLNQYSFLITTVHEFAHLKTYLEHHFRVSPHGVEWKKNYVQLMLPFLENGLLPKDIEAALIRSFVNVKASSCSDTNLHRVLRNYDARDIDEVVLEQLSKNSTFVLEGRRFQKGNLRRTRFMCEDVVSGRKYLISALATVKQINDHGK